MEKEIRDLKTRVNNLETRMAKLEGVALEIKDKVMDIKKALENKVDKKEFVILENRVTKLEMQFTVA